MVYPGYLHMLCKLENTQYRYNIRSINSGFRNWGIINLSFISTPDITWSYFDNICIFSIFITILKYYPSCLCGFLLNFFSCSVIINLLFFVIFKIRSQTYIYFKQNLLLFMCSFVITLSCQNFINVKIWTRIPHQCCLGLLLCIF